MAGSVELTYNEPEKEAVQNQGYGSGSGSGTDHGSGQEHGQGSGGQHHVYGSVQPVYGSSFHQYPTNLAPYPTFPAPVQHHENESLRPIQQYTTYPPQFGLFLISTLIYSSTYSHMPFPHGHVNYPINPQMPFQPVYQQGDPIPPPTQHGFHQGKNNDNYLYKNLR
uniref:Galectin n=1 Tax=Meloidogyne hapla TaxID=6305 RepID=A0A1I8C1B0_MELHA